MGGTSGGQRQGNLARKSDEEKKRINDAYHKATESRIRTILTPSFIALHPYVRRPTAESHYGQQVAAEFAANTSPLVQMLKKGHHGVTLDAPDAPAVRVSWYDAVAFCRAVSEATGQAVQLPTEAQWEWACRAGSDAPFWYGGMDDDFSAFENLAGREQRRFAFRGKRKWHLRDDRFDDRQLVTAAVGSFKPNPWGLFDMHGNVCEWTRSVYRSYPCEPGGKRDAPDSDEERVVRGGSWFDRPADATAARRWKYPPWQKVHTVGFRVAMVADESR